jgi:hypothetical protein
MAGWARTSRLKGRLIGGGIGFPGAPSSLEALRQGISRQMHMPHSTALRQLPETSRRMPGRGCLLIGAGGKFRSYTIGPISSVRIAKLLIQAKSTLKSRVTSRSDASLAIR